MLLLKIIFGFFTIWFTLSVVYILTYAIAGLFYKYRTTGSGSLCPKIAVFIPAYKEDTVILRVATEAVKHRYSGIFKVIVVADQLKKETIEALRQLPLICLEVDFEKSTKAKALNFAMDNLQETFDVAMILDADNVMSDGVLNRISEEFNAGEKAIQAHRCAKSKQSNFAYLDAISEEVNNHIYSKGPAVLGLSSRLVGSGMAFDYTLFKKLMASIDAVGGFDKALELKIIEQKIVIKYINDALVFDEKVDNAQVFEKQRSRWISAQYHFLAKKAVGAFQFLFAGNLDYFLKTFQLALPPRLLLPGFLMMGAVVLSFAEFTFWAYLWGALCLANVFAYAIAIPKSFWNKQLFKVAVSVPKAFFVTCKALLSIGSANKKFIHTPHTGSEVLSVLANNNHKN